MSTRIHLRSPQYTWVKGELLVVGPLRRYGEFCEFAENHDTEDTSEVPLIPIENNEATLDVLEPGVFGILMTEVLAVGTHDGRHISISEIPLGDHEITSADLVAGIKEIVIKPLGTLHVTVVDEGEHRPVAGAAVGFHFEESSSTDTYYADQNGKYTFWALPQGRYSVSSDARSVHEVEVVGNQETTITLIRSTKP